MTRAAWCALGIAMAASAQDYDLVVRNARVRTGEASQPWADSIAVKDGRIAAVGR